MKNNKKLNNETKNLIKAVVSVLVFFCWLLLLIP